MEVDKVARVIYNDPVLVTKMKSIYREQPLEDMVGAFNFKTPIKVQVLLYDQRGRMVAQGETINTYA